MSVSARFATRFRRTTADRRRQPDGSVDCVVASSTYRPSFCPRGSRTGRVSTRRKPTDVQYAWYLASAYEYIDVAPPSRKNRWRSASETAVVTATASRTDREPLYSCMPRDRLPAVTWSPITLVAAICASRYVNVGRR